MHDTHLVAQNRDEFWEVAFTQAGDVTSFAAREDWKPVRQDYVAQLDTVSNFDVVAQFRGERPQVDVDPSVDKQMLFGDEENPFFIELPISKIGAVSRDGLVHDEALLTSIERQLVGAEGIRGHLRDDERGSAFPIPSVFWVGKKRVGDTLYGKGYVPPGETRDDVRRRKAVNGTQPVSIYGRGHKIQMDNGQYRLAPFVLEQVDLAPSSRAALDLGAFEITRQMAPASEPGQEQEEPEMEQDRLAVIRQMTVEDIRDIPQPVVAKLIDTSPVKQERDEAVERLQEADTLIQQMRTELVDVYTDTIVAEMFPAAAALPEEDEFESRQAAQDLLTSFRSELVQQMGKETDQAKIRAKAVELWPAKYERIAQMIVRQAAGGKPNVGNKPDDKRGDRQQKLLEQASKFGENRFGWATKGAQ